MTTPKFAPVHTAPPNGSARAVHLVTERGWNRWYSGVLVLTYRLYAGDNTAHSQGARACYARRCDRPSCAHETMATVPGDRATTDGRPLSTRAAVSHSSSSPSSCRCCSFSCSASPISAGCSPRESPSRRLRPKRAEAAAQEYLQLKRRLLRVRRRRPTTTASHAVAGSVVREKSEAFPDSTHMLHAGDGGLHPRLAADARSDAAPWGRSAVRSRKQCATRSSATLAGGCDGSA